MHSGVSTSGSPNPTLLLFENLLCSRRRCVLCSNNVLHSLFLWKINVDIISKEAIKARYCEQICPKNSTLRPIATPYYPSRSITDRRISRCHLCSMYCQSRCVVVQQRVVAVCSLIRPNTSKSASARSVESSELNYF